MTDNDRLVEALTAINDTLVRIAEALDRMEDSAAYIQVHTNKIADAMNELLDKYNDVR